MGVGGGNSTYKTWKSCKVTACDTLPWLRLPQLLKIWGKCYRDCFSPFWCFWKKKGRVSVNTTNSVMAKQRKTKTKNEEKKLAEIINTEKTEKERQWGKKSANSTQTTKAHRTKESQTLGKQHCLWSVQKRVKYTFSQSESFQFVQFGVCVNWRFPLLFFLFARSVSGSH